MNASVHDDHQGSHASWKFMEIARQWCLLQFLASNRHISADENSHNYCHQVGFLGCRCAKNAFIASPPPRTPLGELSATQILYLLFVAIFKHCWFTTGSWENASGVQESPGFFVTTRVGTLKYSWCQHCICTCIWNCIIDGFATF